jgi:hypothetical protein
MAAFMPSDPLVGAWIRQGIGSIHTALLYRTPDALR